MPVVIKDDFFREITVETRILSPKIIECLRTKGIKADEGVFSIADRKRGEYRVEGDSLGIYGYDDKAAGLLYVAIVQCADIIAGDEDASGDEAAEDPVSEHPSGGSARKKLNAKGGRRTRRRPAGKGTRRR